MPIKLQKRDWNKKIKPVVCLSCGWKGYEKDLTVDREGYEHCPSCKQGTGSQIYEDSTRPDLTLEEIRKDSFDRLKKSIESETGEKIEDLQSMTLPEIRTKMEAR